MSYGWGQMYIQGFWVLRPVNRAFSNFGEEKIAFKILHINLRVENVKQCLGIGKFK